jgi:predicted HicB family RNase H-like nuclease
VNKKHERILQAIFDRPVRANIDWKDIESLFLALGAEIEEGEGSRIRVALGGRKAVFHRPHPEKEAGKGTVRGVQDFLSGAGFRPWIYKLFDMKSKIMKYNGYIGTIEPDIDSGVLFGRVIGIRDVITFQGDTVPELLKAFHDSVDDYLAFCKKRGESPEKPYSGKFVLRLDPRFHRKLAIVAEAKAVSLNDLIKSELRGIIGKKPEKKDQASGQAAKIRARAAGRPPKNKK